MSAGPLIAKLRRFERLSDHDRIVLEAAASLKVRRLREREDLIREGDRRGGLSLILEGWACRYKVLEDGRRQIVAIVLPGDLCDLNTCLLGEADHSIGALTRLRVAEIDRPAFDRLTRDHPSILRAVWCDALVASAIQREWTVNIGQRTAFERISHLMLEIFHRMRTVQLADPRGCFFPITQVEIADALGLTPVHVNRTIQELRSRGLIELADRQLTIPDVQALARIALFNPNYLHLREVGPAAGEGELACGA